MGDVFGGTFMLKLVIIFIVIYVSFATIAVSYAKTFRVKNMVVNTIEQQRLINRAKIVGRMDLIDARLSEASYDLSDNLEYGSLQEKCTSQGKGKSGDERPVFTNNGACILPIKIDDNHYYFRVTLYMVFRIPGIPYVASFPISSDTEDYSYTYKIKKTTG